MKRTVMLIAALAVILRVCTAAAKDQPELDGSPGERGDTSARRFPYQASAVAVPQLISYQGWLTENGFNPVADGNYSLTFRIYDDSTGGSALWTETQVVPVQRGLFTVQLGKNTPLPDNLFSTGPNRFLGVKVNLDPEMTPRTRLASVPFAHHALRADSAATSLDISCAGCVDSVNLGTASVGAAEIADGSIGTGDIADGGVRTADLADSAVTAAKIADGAVTGSKILNGTIEFVDLGQNGAGAGQVIKWDGSAWVPQPDLTSDAGGAFLPLTGGTMSGPINSTGTPKPLIEMGKGQFGTGNLNAGTEAFVAGENNDAAGNWSAVGGGQGNTASNRSAVVGGGEFNRARGQFSTVSGGGGAAPADSNSALGNNSSIGGGLRNLAGGASARVGGGQGNSAAGAQATVGGGLNNSAGGGGASVGGGQSNSTAGTQATISGGLSNNASGAQATVGGGGSNQARGAFSVVSGGGGAVAADSNAASGNNSAVGGGSRNVASGFASAIPGGQNNTAGGRFAFSAGRRAKALHTGTWVWADSTDADLNSTAPNQFLIRASGGVGIGTNSPQQKLHVSGNAKVDDTLFASNLSSNSPLQLLTAGVTRLFVTDNPSGNIGIGTTNPQTKLHVADNTPGTLTNVKISGGDGSFGDDGGGIVSFANNNLEKWRLSMRKAGTDFPLNIVAAAGPTVALTLLENGNVGIGTASPTRKLEVADTIYSSFGGYKFPDGTVQTTASGGIAFLPTAGGTMTGPILSAGNPRPRIEMGKGQFGTANTNNGTEAFAAGGNNHAWGNYSVVSGGGGAAPADSNSALGEASVVGGGKGNVAVANLATVNGGENNVAAGARATVGGGGGNYVSGLYATVAGGLNDSASAEGATVGGGKQNWANQSFATISGGDRNYASNTYATIGGGKLNKAGGFGSTVGGGESNQALSAGSTPASFVDIFALRRSLNLNVGTSLYSTIGGGVSNFADGDASTIGGGNQNYASGQASTVAGGENDTASGSYSTVAGGRGNRASADYSFAAGRRAKAAHIGAFVWADSLDSNISSSAVNQVTMRATGGYRFFTNRALAGAQLSPGATAWSAISDSTMKRNIRVVDGREILSKVLQLPIKRWSYKWQDPGIEHIGPMVQDFYPLFQVGDDEKTISTIDPPGIALAAIQGLYKINQEQEETISRLDLRIKRLEELVEKLLAKKMKETAAGGSFGSSR